MLSEYLKCLLDTLYYIGVIGITLNRGALQRWILGQSERSAITRECMKMAGADPADRKLMLLRFLFTAHVYQGIYLYIKITIN